MDEAVLAIVANYDFSDEADDLKARLAPFFPTLLIDNSSPTTPRTADVVLPNRYYSGLWNEAVRLALERRKPWLLFVASDVNVPDTARLASGLRSVVRRRSVGVYTPALRHDSRAAFRATLQRNTGGLRECFVIEGFCFLARTEILARLYPVDPEANRYGWGIDIMTACHAYRTGHKAMVDDRVVIHHPAARHAIPTERSQQQQLEYLGDEGLRFLRWTDKRLNRERQWREIPRRWAAEVAGLWRRTFDSSTVRPCRVS
jgi:hypothetical protein